MKQCYLKQDYQNQNTVSLPYSVHYADWIRQNERKGARVIGVSLYELMERAGKAAFDLCQQTYPQARHWLILCGHGNNGGDGYVVGRLARIANINVTLLACQGNSPLPDEAERARQAWLESGGKIEAPHCDWPDNIDLIVDGLLGNGLNRAPQGQYATLIAMANQHCAPIVALDIPSGLGADTGWGPGEVIKADQTQTFIALKPGLLTGQARRYVGKLHCDNLGLGEWLSTQSVQIERLAAHKLPEWFVPRDPCAHKGEFGKLVCIGGDKGAGGAIRMTGEAALRSGTGLVKVLTRAEHVAPILAARPELMAQSLTKASLQNAIEWADCVVVGPGLGQQNWGQDALQAVLATQKPMLWDADALNLLALSPGKRSNRILTPHPGEAARLLACSVAEIEHDRLQATRRLVQRYGGVVLLKGPGTIIADEAGNCAIADIGNPGMATGGMGDVLSGIIGAFMAQKMPLYQAACAGCVVSGLAADNIVSRRGVRGLLATEVIDEIPLVINPN